MTDRELIHELADTLGWLFDLHNGCPLEKYRRDWERTMKRADCILNIVREVYPQPRYDPGSLDRFEEAGRVAWADVPDAAKWLREARGGS